MKQRIRTKHEGKKGNIGRIMVKNYWFLCVKAAQLQKGLLFIRFPNLQFREGSRLVGRWAELAWLWRSLLPRTVANTIFLSIRLPSIT